jgi:hypothetical protein
MAGAPETVDRLDAAGTAGKGMVRRDQRRRVAEAFAGRELEVGAGARRYLAGLVADGAVLEVAEGRPVLAEVRAVQFTLPGVVGEEPAELVVDFAVGEAGSAAERH